jgi:large subunit ribosomal protein L35e
MSTEQLEVALREQKAQLLALRVARVASPTPAKLSKLRTTRQQIARILTIVSERSRAEARAAAKEGKMPLDLRTFATRASRRALTKEERSIKSARVAKALRHNPKRVYALSA